MLTWWCAAVSEEPVSGEQIRQQPPGLYEPLFGLPRMYRVWFGLEHTYFDWGVTGPLKRHAAQDDSAAPAAS
jgi:hypothetical protein